MYTGKVVGSVVATVKDERLRGIKLLLVQTVENGKPGKTIVAGDQTGQAGSGGLCVPDRFQRSEPDIPHGDGARRRGNRRVY